MSEGNSPFFAPTFSAAVKVRSEDERITSDAGVLLLREGGHRLCITADPGREMYDPRNADFVRYTLTELLRERIYALAPGNSARDDLDIPAHDPAVKAAVWDRPRERVVDERLAGQPTQSRLIDIIATYKGNFEVLRAWPARSVLRHQRAVGSDRAVVRGTPDIDGFPTGVFGDQQGAARPTTGTTE